MNQHETMILRQAKTRLPKLFKLAYPRNLIVPDGFSSPEFYGAVICGHVNTVNNPLMNQRAHNTSYGVAMGLLANRVPTYFIADEFARAVANTDLPGDFKFDELKWPMQAQMFVLSDNFSTDYYGFRSPYLCVVRLEKGRYPETLPRSLPRAELDYPLFVLDSDQILFDCAVFSNNVVMTYNGCYPMSSGISMFETSAWHDATPMEEKIYPQLAEKNIDMTPEQEREFITKGQQMAVKLLLTIAELPGLVEHGTVTRHAKVDQATKRIISPELVSPNIIGRTYRIPRKYTERAPGDSRAKPRFKYRRGHHVWQAKRRKDAAFISVNDMPRKADGFMDFDVAGPDKTAIFRGCHERIWIQGFLFDQDDPASADASPV